MREEDGKVWKGKLIGFFIRRELDESKREKDGKVWKGSFTTVITFLPRAGDCLALEL